MSLQCQATRPRCIEHYSIGAPVNKPHLVARHAVRQRPSACVARTVQSTEVLVLRSIGSSNRVQEAMLPCATASPYALLHSGFEQCTPSLRVHLRMLSGMLMLLDSP